MIHILRNLERIINHNFKIKLYCQTLYKTKRLSTNAMLLISGNIVHERLKFNILLFDILYNIYFVYLGL